MLTLAFAQIVWSIVFQWDSVTGGSNGLTGIWPAVWLSDKRAYYALTLGFVAASVWAMRRMLFAPFGYAMRASRDSPLRSDAIGLNVAHIQWLAFTLAGAFAGLAGALYAFSKGSISPDVLGVGRSVDALVMVLLGGLQTLAGPLVVGAVAGGSSHADPGALLVRFALVVIVPLAVGVALRSRRPELERVDLEREGVAAVTVAVLVYAALSGSQGAHHLGGAVLASGIFLLCSAALVRTDKVVWKMPPVLARARSIEKPTSSSATWITPPALTTKSGAYRIARAARASAIPGCASWLLAAPQTTEAVSTATVSSSRAPPRAQGEYTSIGVRTSASASATALTSGWAAVTRATAAGSTSATTTVAPSPTRCPTRWVPTLPTPHTPTVRPDSDGSPQRTWAAARIPVNSP